MVQRKPQWTKLGRYDRLRGLLQIYVPRLTRGTGVYQEENRGLLRGRGFERYRYRLQPFRGCYPADYPLAEIRYRARPRISAMGFWLSPGHDREVQGRLRI